MPKKYYLFLIFLIPILFPQIFNHLWSEYIVVPILKHFSVGMYSIVKILMEIYLMIIFLCAVLYFLYFYVKKNYLFSTFQLLIFSIIPFIYSSYRYKIYPFHSFDFYKFLLTPKIAYTDFIFILFVPLISTLINDIKNRRVFVDLLGYLSPFLKRIEKFIELIKTTFESIIRAVSNIIIQWKFFSFFKKIYNKILYLWDYVTPNKNKIGGFIPDLPLNESELERLEEKTTVGEFTENLAKRLLNTKSENAAFAVGISGEWGTGKTTLMKLLKKQLENQSSENILIDFNPWNSNSSQAIVSDFFATFQENLSEYSAEIETYINSYTNKLVNIDGYDFISTIFKLSAHFFNENKSLTQEHEAINEILHKIDRQIFIFIDDLDRLDKTEIIEVIRLIRNSANFHNVFFIVAYDKGYIEQAIEELNQHNKSFFLEKIFQLELHIPAYEYHYILTDLHKRLVEAIPFLNENQEVKNFIKSHKELHQIIQNYRDVKRFVNSFSLVYNKKIAEETYFPDFFHVELLRFKFPLVYELLKKGEISLSSKYISEYDRSYDKSLAAQTKEDLLSKIREMLRTRNYYPFKIEAIITFILELANGNSLFINSSDYRISNEKHFPTYFAYRTFDNIIGNIEFANARKDIETLRKKISEWSSRNLNYDFIQKCKALTISRNESLSDKEKEILIEGLFYSGRFMYDSLYGNNQSLLLKLFEFEDIVMLENFLQYIFYTNKNHYPYTSEISFLYRLNEIRNNVFSISKEKRYKLMIKYLTEICNKETSFLIKNNQYILYIDDFFWLTAKLFDENTHQVIGYNERVKEIIKSFFEKNINSSLGGFIMKRDDKYNVYFDNFAKIFFETTDAFETWLKSLEEKIEVDKYNEFWDFYEKSKIKVEKEGSIHYSFNYIDYEFKHLEVRK